MCIFSIVKTIDFSNASHIHKMRASSAVVSSVMAIAQEWINSEYS